MRQNLYTCCRCGKEQRTAAESDDPPLGWAQINLSRTHVEKVEGGREMVRTDLQTHSCSECCAEVVIFLEKSTRPTLPGVDDAFDDGGVS